VLDLDPAVQLEEEELSAAEHELRGARTPIADRVRERHRRVAHRAAQGLVESRGGRLLQHLLVAPLDRALALAEGDHVAVCVCEELNLDVAWPLDVALAEDAVVPESGLRLSRGGRKRLVQLLWVANDPHAAPAAAGGRLDHERVPDLARLALRNDRDAGFGGDPLGLELVAARPKRLRGRPHPGEPGRLDGRGELGVLGQEAVPRVDRVGAGLLGGPNVLLRVEVPRDLDDLVGRPRVQALAIVGRSHRDRADAALAASPEDADGDLAAVGYEEFADLHGPRRTRLSRQRTDRIR
jgi:hypothetical protein